MQTHVPFVIILIVEALWFAGLYKITKYFGKYKNEGMGVFIYMLTSIFIAVIFTAIWTFGEHSTRW